MFAELVSGKLCVFPQCAQEAVDLASFMEVNSPESLADNLMLNVGTCYRGVTPMVEDKATGAKMPEEPKDDMPPAGSVDERAALVAKCDVLGIEHKGKRTNTLKKLVEEAENAPPPEDPVEEEKKAEASGLTRDGVLELCKRHLKIFKGPSLKRVLEQFDAESFSDVHISKWGDLVKALTAEAKAMREEKEGEECQDELLG